ncbi:MAG: transketolase [Alphaproteobacteria bacterium CG_4_10_14_0_2_um_filter_63_37]|nr:MAG: transketolase [Proteobacteria bacterium CG1_02_64_396]PJA23798.1 MAG: transketolase [Alphaproteobacteria bacterium CG_4_10_14_0_2_um_filter_63_37]
MTASNLDQRAINTIRGLAIDMVQQANSGHPGLPLGAAPMAYALWDKHLRHNPADPKWVNRDRFVLSPGHGSALLYSLLHLTGYDLSLDDLKQFRQWESRTPGHPEDFMTPGVEATTGPLGQGSANAVGMALAERWMAARYNRPGHTIVDHFTYAIVSDGDLMEGISAEAASLAGHQKLGKLIYLYDANDITLDGPCELSFGEEVGSRYEAYGWQVLRVADGDHDVAGLSAAIEQAKSETERPSIIIVKTTIGFGSPHKAGTSSCHGSPLGEDELALTKQALGLDPALRFELPSDAVDHLSDAVRRGHGLQAQWNRGFDAYAKAFPDLAEEFLEAASGDLPEGWEEAIPTFPVGEKVATRAAGGKILNALAGVVPWLLGGDADLSGSTNTRIKSDDDNTPETPAGRNFRFGVREHAMGAIVNGMAYHGGVRPYCATFFVFSDYMRGSVRVSALSNLPVIYVWTHDSIGVGEDGPTHQPIEHLASLRAMPDLAVFRPADANETAIAWKMTLKQQRPSALIMSRQNLPTLDAAAVQGAEKGGYVLAEASSAPQAVLIATGSEVHVALAAREALEAGGIPTRVVSLPCVEIFEEQEADYKNSVIPRDVAARVTIEAGVTLGWHKYAGDGGACIGIDRFGASAPGDENMERFGFTADNVVNTVKGLLD